MLKAIRCDRKAHTKTLGVPLALLNPIAGRLGFSLSLEDSKWQRAKTEQVIYDDPLTVVIHCAAGDIDPTWPKFELAIKRPPRLAERWLDQLSARLCLVSAHSAWSLRAMVPVGSKYNAGPVPNSL